MTPTTTSPAPSEVPMDSVPVAKSDMSIEHQLLVFFAEFVKRHGDGPHSAKATELLDSFIEEHHPPVLVPQKPLFNPGTGKEDLQRLPGSVTEDKLPAGVVAVPVNAPPAAPVAEPAHEE